MTEKRVQWFWKCNTKPYSNEDLSEWNRYSDIENAIIEEAFLAKKSNIILDDYHLDFEHQIQISNNDINKQRPIQRMEINRDDERLREARFMINPIVPTNSFHHLIGFQKIFIDKFIEVFNLKSLADWEHRKHDLMEKAMSGILYEGQLAGKQSEAQWIIQQLDRVKNKTKREIGECCVYLYTLESFLYKLINQTMRLIGEKDYEQIWQTKITTLGPFTYLLHYYLSYENVTHRTSQTVYRGAQLTEDMIEQYRQVARRKDSRRSFQTFTSSSRNQMKAEEFGNVLFLFNPKSRTLNMNISSLSAYPNEEEEEEVLIRPGRSFQIDHVEYNQMKKKYFIYLTSISTTDKHPISSHEEQDED